MRPYIMHTSQLLRDVSGLELRCRTGACDVRPRREPRCPWIFNDGSNLLVSQVLYMFEYNVRASAIVGFVGAGGVGVYIQRDLGAMQ